MLPAFCPQIAPTGPVLPIVPTHKCFTVYYLRFEILHGMEEVIGSIPIRSTTPCNNKADIPKTIWVRTGRKFQYLLHCSIMPVIVLLPCEASRFES